MTMCYKIYPFTILLPSLLLLPPHLLLLPPPLPHSPCPVNGVGHEHSTPTVVVCCVHCTTRGSHTPGVPQCVHTHVTPPPPRCRAGPRPKDQVLFLKSLLWGWPARPIVGWLDPCRVSPAWWVLGTVASHDHHIHHAGIRLTRHLDWLAGG